MDTNDASVEERAGEGNRLGRETSPYLLQHQENPVHWWAWGPEALAEAKRTGKPILLSVGYAACHWCHVMAHESFEDGETAEVMNDLFVNIKVDREERPDVDAIYMSALHELGEQGGWPLTMFLTSDAEPFWGGTYFPKQARYGRPAFGHVLKEIARIYRDEPDKVRQNATALKQALAPKFEPGPDAIPGDAALEDLARRLLQLVDPTHGGIRGAPKFPQSQFFTFLWRAGSPLRIAQSDRGGDAHPDPYRARRHLRSSRWRLRPLQRGRALARAAFREDALRQRAAARADDRGVARNRRSAVRAPHSRDHRLADARDGHGRRGLRFVARRRQRGRGGEVLCVEFAEIEEVLGAEDANLFAEIYDVTPEGNFEGHTILNRINTLELRDDAIEARLVEMRAKLLVARASRIRPSFDDKVLADWNGLLIAALAKAADVFVRVDWLEAVERAFDFVSTQMIKNDRLLHSYCAGEARAPATATDYANIIKAALALASVTGNPEYIARAREWVDVLDRHYWAEGHGGYFLAADDTDDLIVRTINALDDATPNANGTMVSNLMQLYLWTGEERYRDRAEAIVRGFSGAIAKNVFSHTGLLSGVIDLLAPAHIVIVVPEGGDANALRRALADVSLPNAVVQELRAGILRVSTSVPPNSPAHGKTAIGGKPTAYVCIGPQCSAPVTDAAALVEAVREGRQGKRFH